jgi:dienelactone hydrolase
MHLLRIALPAAFSLASLALLAGCGADSPDPGKDPPPVTPPNYEAAGPYAVGNATIAIDDAARNRHLRVEIWYPAAESARATAEKGFPVAEFADPGAERVKLAQLIAAAPDPGTSRIAHSARGAAAASADKWPVVAFSHCFNGTRFSTLSIAERLASHGIAVVAPDHTGGTLADQLAGTAAALDVKFLETRAKDIEIILDRLLDSTAAELPAELRGHFDPARVGVFGHSFGGVTAGLVLTQDPRPIAGLALAVPMENPLLPGVTVATLKVPLFFLRAAEDNSIGAAGDFVIDENFKDATSPVWKANVADAGHWSFTDICGIVPDFHAGCGMGERQTNGAAFEYLDIKIGRGIAQAYTTAFFAAKLTGAAAGETYLGGSRPEGIVTVTHRN